MNDDENNNLEKDNNLGQDYTKMEKNLGKNAKKITKTTLKTTGNVLRSIIRIITVKGIALILIPLVLVLSLAFYWYAIKKDQNKQVNKTANEKMIGRNGLSTEIICNINEKEPEEGKTKKDIEPINTKEEINDEERKYEIDMEELQKEVKEYFIESGISTVELENEDKELEGLNAFVEAEVRSSFPDLRKRDKIGTPAEEGELQGTLQFVRRIKKPNDPDDLVNELTKLEFMPYKGFMKVLLDAGLDPDTMQAWTEDEDIVLEAYDKLADKFTLDENYNLVVVNLSTEKRVVEYSEFALADGKTNPKPDFYYILEAKTVDYSSVSKKYRMPFDFLMALLMNSQSYVFCNEVANLTKDHEIIIDLQDFWSTEVIKERFEFDVTIEVEKHWYYESVLGNSGGTATTSSGEQTPSPDAHPYRTVTTTKKNNEVELHVTLAKNWIYNYIAEYKQFFVLENDKQPTPGDYEYYEDDNMNDEEFECDNDHGVDAPYPSIPEDTYITGTSERIIQRRKNKEREAPLYVTIIDYEKNVLLDEIVPERFLSLLQVDPELISEETKKPIYNVEERDRNTKIPLYLSTFTSIENPKDKQSMPFSPIDDLLSSRQVLNEFLLENPKTVRLAEVMTYLLDVLEGKRKVNRSEDLASIREKSDILRSTSIAWESKPEFLRVDRFSSAEMGWHWTCLHENAAVWYFKNAGGAYSSYVSRYITADGKYYIMYTEEPLNDTKNYGFGVNIFQNGKSNHVAAFAKYGIDITDPKYRQKGALLPVDIVDRVSYDFWMSKREDAINTIRSMGYSENDFESYQLDCLADCRYQGWGIKGIVSTYIASGKRPTEAVRNHSAFLVNACNGQNRGNDRWLLFSQGIYALNGKEVPEIQAAVANAQTSGGVGLVYTPTGTENERQLAIMRVALNSGAYGITHGAGYCLKWVNDVYQAAGIPVSRVSTASYSGYLYGVSTDWTNIPVGAAVYGYSSYSGSVRTRRNIYRKRPGNT